MVGGARPRAKVGDQLYAVVAIKRRDAWAVGQQTRAEVTSNPSSTIGDGRQLGDGRHTVDCLAISLAAVSAS